jgi:hypothetical protein
VTAATGSNATTIATNAVTNAKLADMAAATIKGRVTGSGTGDPMDLTPDQARATIAAASAIHTHSISDVTNLQTELNLKAPLASPVFTGNPTAPTAAAGDNDLSIANTEFVQQELAAGTAVAKNLEVYVRNMAGASMPAGTIVYINGSNGNRPTITKAQANSDANSAQTFGFTKTALADGAFGFVIVRGELVNVNTFGLGEGTQLYLSPDTAGQWTTSKPSAPQHLVYVGIVVRDHPTQGVILVAIQNGYELNEIHDVAISSPTTGQFLKRNAGNTLWVNSGIVSADITDATSAPTSNVIVKRNADGGASFSGGVSGYAVQADSIASTAILGQSVSGTGLNGSSYEGVGVIGQSDSNAAGTFTSSSGPSHATFGNNADNRSFIARVKGAFGWFRGVWTGRIQAADTLTANRTWTLPDTTGTIALTNDPRFIDARPPLAHTHVSADITDATSGGNGVADAGKLVEYGDIGEIRVSLNEGPPVTFGGIGIVSGGYEGAFWQLGHTTLTTDRFYSLPDASGTLMLGDQNLAEITNPALARDALGSGTVGDQVFTSETQSDVYDIIGIRPITRVEYTSGSGIIDIPSDAKLVSFLLIGGGGGGGSGCRKAPTTAGSGGSGGTPGRWVAVPPIPISELGTSSVLFSVGEGGVGGPARTTNDTAGQTGTVGGVSSITFAGTTIAASGGSGGPNGAINQNSSSVAGIGGSHGVIGYGGFFITTASNPSLITGNSAAIPLVNNSYPTSGGPAGGMSAAGTIYSGAAGGTLGVAAYSVVGGSAGTGISPTGKVGKTSLVTRAGTGGGGARTSDTTFSGNAGGNGGLYGGGGGGGSPSNNGWDSGAGGNGAGGLVQVTFYY